MTTEKNTVETATSTSVNGTNIHIRHNAPERNIHYSTMGRRSHLGRGEIRCFLEVAEHLCKRPLQDAPAFLHDVLDGVPDAVQVESKWIHGRDSCSHGLVCVRKDHLPCTRRGGTGRDGVCVCQHQQRDPGDTDTCLRNVVGVTCHSDVCGIIISNTT